MLVLGSGNVVHNLRLFDFRDPTPREWAIRADEEIRAHVAARDHDALVEYPAREDAHRFSRGTGRPRYSTPSFPPAR